MKILISFYMLIAVAWCGDTTAKVDTPTVSIIRVPQGGLQPQIIEKEGVVHLLYFLGMPEAGNLYYVKSRDYGQTFSKPIQVNHREGSAIAIGNIRGAQLAVGRKGRVHVAWNGASSGGRSPMLYARTNDAGTGFEPERNVIGSAYGLDGGGTLAADSMGDVYVFWHAPLPGLKGEQNRRVWEVKSTDDGTTFESEKLAFDKRVGACGCCGMKAYADDAGGVQVLFRSADQVVNRDIWLLTSIDHGRTFRGTDVSSWHIGACVMSSEAFAASPDGLLAAWETEKQTYFGRVVDGAVSTSIAAPGLPNNRKYPVLAGNSRGETLFAWTEGMGWKKGGSVAWQVYSKDNRLTATSGKAEGVPVWSFIAAFAKPGGGFVVAY